MAGKGTDAPLPIFERGMLPSTRVDSMQSDWDFVLTPLSPFSAFKQIFTGRIEMRRGGKRCLGEWVQLRCTHSPRRESRDEAGSVPRRILNGNLAAQVEG